MAKGKRPTSEFHVAGKNLGALGTKPSTAGNGSSTKTRSTNAKEFKPSQKTGSDINTAGDKSSSH